MEQAFQDVWLKNLPEEDEPALLKGLPLVEGVTFLRAHNYGTESGNCYWRAVSFLIYGTPDYWPRVKEEHRYYIERVQNNRDHPRNQKYAEMNKGFSETNITLNGKVKTKVLLNMSQQLRVRGSWTTSDMRIVTADLYGIFLVYYDIDFKSTVPVVNNVRTTGTFVRFFDPSLLSTLIMLCPTM